MKVYEKVKKYIICNHLKQIEIAEKAGYKVSTFNAILNGKRTMYVEDLIEICKALNVDVEVFLNNQQDAS